MTIDTEIVEGLIKLMQRNVRVELMLEPTEDSLVRDCFRFTVGIGHMHTRWMGEAMLSRGTSRVAVRESLLRFIRHMEVPE